MKVSEFNYDLPEELIAQTPLEKRDESRLMVLNRKNQTIEHKKFKDIIDKAMFMKEQELGEIIDVLNEEESLKTNEATIREMLI